MKNLGFKLIDDIDIKDDVFKLIEYSNKMKLPIELAIYKEDKEFYTEIMKKSKYLNTIHLSKQCVIYNTYKSFDFSFNIIKNEIIRGVENNIFRFVLHPHQYNFNLSGDFENKTLNMLIERIISISKWAKDYNDKINIFIENMFDPIILNKKLFSMIHDEHLNNIHFCFDIGHAKVWSKATIEEWLIFLNKLKNEYNKNFHMHIHFNSGFGDEHLSLNEFNDRHLTQRDVFFSKNKDVIDIIKDDLIDIYNGENDFLVMEMNPKHQIETYEKIMKL